MSVYRPPLVSIGEFREHVRAASTDREGPVLIVNYSRKAVGQAGDGHFSPIGGYHVATDRILLLDTARFKYPPHWLSLELLFEAMREVGRATQCARGWLMLQRRADFALGRY